MDILKNLIDQVLEMFTLILSVNMYVKHFQKHYILMIICKTYGARESHINSSSTWSSQVPSLPEASFSAHWFSVLNVYWNYESIHANSVQI